MLAFQKQEKNKALSKVLTLLLQLYINLISERTDPVRTSNRANDNQGERTRYLAIQYYLWSKEGLCSLLCQQRI